MNGKSKYDDIINMPHHVSEKRAHMPLADRAAQFSPFAALTGYDDAVRETARHTNEKPELDDYEKEILSGRLSVILEHLHERPQVTVAYFLPDGKKSGGECVDINGEVKKIDLYKRLVCFYGDTEIPIDDIVDIQSDELIFYDVM